MTLYAVSREGVYRHEIVGIYEDGEVAVTRACTCAKEERDDYHEFYVLKFELNKDVRDGDIFAVIRRNQGAITINRMVYGE